MYHTKNKHLSQSNVNLNYLFHIIYNTIEDVLIVLYFPTLGAPLFMNLGFQLFPKLIFPKLLKLRWSTGGRVGIWWSRWSVLIKWSIKSPWDCLNFPMDLVLLEYHVSNSCVLLCLWSSILHKILHPCYIHIFTYWSNGTISTKNEYNIYTYRWNLSSIVATT